MRYVLSQHAEKEMIRRDIPREVIEAVANFPEQVAPGAGTVTCRQSRIDFGGRMYLVRVLVNDTIIPPIIVTVYRTSRIVKYWEAGI